MGKVEKLPYELPVLLYWPADGLLINPCQGIWRLELVAVHVARN